MDRLAAWTSPAPHGESFKPLGALARAADGALLGGVALVDLPEPSACVIALVLQHGSVAAPAGVVHALGEPRSSQLGGIHIADEDGRVLAHARRGVLVQEVLPAVGDLGVQRTHAVLLARALGAGDLRFQIAIEALRLDLVASAVGDEILESQVDADGAR